MLEERPERRLPSRRASKRRRGPLHAEDRRRARRRLPSTGAAIALQVAARARRAASAQPWTRTRSTLGRGQLAPVGDRPRGEALEPARRAARLAEREQDLAGRGRVRDAGPPDRATLWTERRALDEVDGDGVVLAGDESVAVSPVSATSRSRWGAPPRAGRGRASTAFPSWSEPEARAGSGRSPSTARRAAAPRASRGAARRVLALIPVRRASSFVPSSPRASASASSTRERALDGGDLADGWLSCAGHGTFSLTDFDTLLPRRQ